MARLLVLLLTSMCLLTGCGDDVPPPAPPLGPAEHARTTLEMAAQDGQVSSDVLALQSYFEEMKQTDPAKAEALLKDLNVMIEAGTSPMGGGASQVKKKAQEMLGKL